MLEIAHAGAAILLLDGDAEQAEVAELAPEVHGEFVGAVDLGGARRDLGVGEFRHPLAQHVGGLAELEVERPMEHARVRKPTAPYVRKLILP